MALSEDLSTPAQHKGRAALETPEALLREANALLEARGITVGKTKVVRAVRAWLRRLPGSTTPFEEWILSALGLDLARVISYRDPTGETAVNNTLRETNHAS